MEWLSISTTSLLLIFAILSCISKLREIHRETVAYEYTHGVRTFISTYIEKNSHLIYDDYSAYCSEHGLVAVNETELLDNMLRGETDRETEETV